MAQTGASIRLAIEEPKSLYVPQLNEVFARVLKNGFKTVTGELGLKAKK
jgi:hypothetical protein